MKLSEELQAWLEELIAELREQLRQTREREVDEDKPDRKEPKRVLH